MKRLALLATACAVFAAPALAQTGVSVSVGQPGFYGRIDIGNAPPPVLVYPQPVVIQQVRGAQPVYLHVPPGHAKDWRKHCGKYNACAQPVYFVKDDWYNTVYVPHYQSQKGKGNGKGNGKGKG
jgi:hypothetical protein